MDAIGEGGGGEGCGGAIFERRAFCKIPPLWRAIIYILAGRKFCQFTYFEALFQSVSLEFCTGIKLEKGKPTLQSISMQRPYFLCSGFIQSFSFTPHVHIYTAFYSLPLPAYPPV